MGYDGVIEVTSLWGALLALNGQFVISMQALINSQDDSNRSFTGFHQQKVHTLFLLLHSCADVDYLGRWNGSIQIIVTQQDKLNTMSLKIMHISIVSSVLASHIYMYLRREIMFR